MSNRYNSNNLFFNSSPSSIKTVEFPEFTRIETLVSWVNSNRLNKHNFKKYPNKIIKIDFQRCKFLKSYHIAPLACILYEYHTAGFKIIFLNLKPHIEFYFKSCHFDQFTSNTMINELEFCNDCKTFPLWRIEQSRIDVYPSMVQEYFERLQFSGKSLFALGSSLSELFNNVFDHSQSSIPGYTFTQYNSRDHCIHTCVCDLGIGIPKKVNQFLKEKGLPTLNNIDALIKSFEKNFTTQSKPHNSGQGLDNIINIARAYKSRLLFLSNNALFNLRTDGQLIKGILRSYFPGTLVILYLDSNLLPFNENEIDDEILIM